MQAFNGAHGTMGALATSALRHTDYQDDDAEEHDEAEGLEAQGSRGPSQRLTTARYVSRTSRSKVDITVRPLAHTTRKPRRALLTQHTGARSFHHQPSGHAGRYLHHRCRPLSIPSIHPILLEFVLLLPLQERQQQGSERQRQWTSCQQGFGRGGDAQRCWHAQRGGAQTSSVQG